MRRTPLIPVAAAALSLLGTVFAPAAHAAEAETVADGLITPLSVAVAPDGTAYAAQNFASMLTKAAPGGEAEVIFADEGCSEVGAVSVEGDVVTFATTSMGGKPSAHLYSLTATEEGYDQARVANLFKYEKVHNPDGGVKYGFANLSRSCREKTPGKETYKGIVESHPYATNVAADGVTYVADAAANAILAVTDDGAVSTVAVLPVNKAKITKQMKNQHDLPKCFIGGTWRAEAVPTDVEMGPDGNLYVTSLPGGHETNGSVFQVNPGTGAVTKIMGGLVSPTGLAIAPNGTAYVASLFAGVIMQKPLGGEASVFAEVPFPGDVEVIDGYVYATETDLTNDGTSAPAGKVLRWSTTG